MAHFGAAVGRLTWCSAQDGREVMLIYEAQLVELVDDDYPCRSFEQPRRFHVIVHLVGPIMRVRCP
jgi:hypothetical protein